MVVLVFVDMAAEARNIRSAINADGVYEPMFNEWYFQTDGSNLLQVLSDPDVDQRRTSTNDIVEILNCLGVLGYLSDEI
jgi:hypothetical protein